MMVVPIYFPVFNPNFFRYYKNLDEEEYTPTLNDWIEKYTHSDGYEQDKEWLYVRIGIATLKFFAKIGILIEIEINHLAWKYIDSKTWYHIHDVCEKLVTKMQEYRHGCRQLYVCETDSATSRIFERLWSERVSQSFGTSPAA